MVETKTVVLHYYWKHQHDGEATHRVVFTFKAELKETPQIGSSLTMPWSAMKIDEWATSFKVVHVGHLLKNPFETFVCDDIVVVAERGPDIVISALGHLHKSCDDVVLLRAWIDGCKNGWNSKFGKPPNWSVELQENRDGVWLNT